jgi:phospholipid/cholesterol/gamma-HCH transport system substrate-binding protein
MANLTKGQKVRLGLFVGTAALVLAGATLLLAGRALTEERDTYRVRFSSKAASFSGLSVGSDVTYSGIKIGRVESLAVASDDVSVIAVGISVTHGTPIAEDSLASLGSQGITGMKYIDVSRGSAHVRVRKPGELIPPGESMMDGLTARASSIGEKLDTLLVHLQDMTGAQAQHSVQQILEETAGLVKDNRADITAIIGNARKTSDEMTVLAHSLNAVVQHADQLVVEASGVTGELRRTIGPKGEAVQTLAKVEKLVDSLNMVVLRSQSDIDVTLRHLRDAAADMADFSQAVKENPTLLMFSSDRSSDGRIGK